MTRKKMWEYLIYGFVALMVITILTLYLLKLRKETKVSDAKLDLAKIEGTHIPVSLYPMIDPNRCLGSGACVKACPEHDILGIRQGRGTIINASQCIGHGACMRACPTHAISLWIGTEQRGVDLPHIQPTFETNVPGIYIAGELGGMGLIRNAIVQGKEAVDNLAVNFKKGHHAEYDLIIVGGGPAGISAALEAKKMGLSAIILEQSTLGGTVFTFPRSKIIMTAPVELPLYGRLKFRETTKPEILEIWQDVISRHNIKIIESHKVELIEKEDDHFRVKTNPEKDFTSKMVLLAIGRRGTPRKLNVPGELLSKVAYKLMEPEDISAKKILVVGGGDSAVESAILLAEQNEVHLSYRSDKFSRIKPKNAEKIMQMIEDGKIKALFNTQVLEITETDIKIQDNEGEIMELPNDLIYIFAGGELPTEFLKKSGIEVTTKKGELYMKVN